MFGFRKRRSSTVFKLAALVLFSLSLVLVPVHARAGVATGSGSGNFTLGGVSGSGWAPTTTVTITYATTPIPTVKHATTNTLGEFFSPQPVSVPDGTAWTASGTEATSLPGTATGTLSQLFRPPNNRVVTVFTVQPGSTATVLGTTIPLSGQFEAVETAFDNNPASPTFGAMSGEVLSNNFLLGSPGVLSFALNSNTPFTINVSPLLNAATECLQNSASCPNGRDNNLEADDRSLASTSVPSLPVSTTLNFNTESFPLSGFVSGTATYLPDEQSFYALNASLAGLDGLTASAIIYACASSELVPTGVITAAANISAISCAPPARVPEPSSWSVVAMALAAVALARQRGQDERAV